MKIKNNKGPKTEPWGIPDNTRWNFENAPPTYVLNVLSDRKSLIISYPSHPNSLTWQEACSVEHYQKLCRNQDKICLLVHHPPTCQ